MDRFENLMRGENIMLGNKNENLCKYCTGETYKESKVCYDCGGLLLELRKGRRILPYTEKQIRGRVYFLENRIICLKVSKLMTPEFNRSKCSGDLTNL